MHAHLLNRFPYRIATNLVQVVRSLIHPFPLGGGARWIYCQERRSRRIVLAVDGAGFAAVEAAPVAGKGDQVGHKTITAILPLPYGRGSA